MTFWELLAAWFERWQRKLAIAGVSLLALWLGTHVLFGQNGMVVYQKKKAEYRKVQVEIQTLEEEQARLAEAVKALRTDPKAIEEEARERLGYVKPGEKVFRLHQATPRAQEPARAEKR